MRPMRPEEEARLRETLSSFDDDLPARLKHEEGAELWIDDGSPQRVFLVRSELAKALRGAKDHPAPSSVGLHLGELRAHSFLPSLEGAYEIGRRSPSSRVLLKAKGAQLFLYGRDVLGESILRADPRARPGTTALVANEAGEVLGMAKVLAQLPGRGRVLEPIVDRGWYLREGG